MEATEIGPVTRPNPTTDVSKITFLSSFADICRSHINKYSAVSKSKNRYNRYLASYIT